MGTIRLIKGSDDVLRQQVTSGVIDEIVGAGDRGLLLDEHAGLDFELAAAVDAAATMPFLTEKRVVVIRHLGRFPNAEALKPLLEYLSNPLESTDLVLVWERSPEPGSRLGNVPPTLAKAVPAAGGEVVSSDAPTKNREAWVASKMLEYGLKLDRGAASMVAEHFGENSGQVIALARSLQGVFGEGVRLGSTDVRPWMGEAGGVPPWELTDAIEKGDAPKALDLLKRMRHGGGRHELQIMATLQSHYLRVLRLDGSSASDEKSAAMILGLKGSTFPAKKALATSKQLGSAGISRAIGLLSQADLDLRGAQAWPGDLVLEVLIGRLAALHRARRR